MSLRVVLQCILKQNADLLTKPLLPMVFPNRGGLLLAAEQLGFPGGGGIGRSFILRLAGLYGPDRHLFLENVRNGETQSGDGDRILNLIHRDDAVSALFAVLQAGDQNIGRIYNVSDGNHFFAGRDCMYGLPTNWESMHLRLPVVMDPMLPIGRSAIIAFVMS